MSSFYQQAPPPVPVSIYCTAMEVDDPVNGLLSLSSLSISPPQSFPTQMEVAQAPSSQASQSPFSLENCGFRHSSRSNGRLRNPFAGESAQKRRQRRDNRAKTETRPRTPRGGDKRMGQAKYQKRQPEGSRKPKPKGQQRKQKPRQPRKNRNPKKAEAKEDKPVNPFTIQFAWGKGQGQRR